MYEGPIGEGLRVGKVALVEEVWSPDGTWAGTSGVADDDRVAFRRSEKDATGFRSIG
jgi:hypothetical protein